MSSRNEKIKWIIIGALLGEMLGQTDIVVKVVTIIG